MKIEDNNVIEQEEGHIKNCGQSQLSGTWSPKVLEPSGRVNVTLDYTAPYDMTSGYYDAQVYFVGDTEPFVGYSDQFKCNEFDQYIQCPIKANQSFKRSQVIQNLRVLASYPGDYTAQIRVFNEKNKEMLCAEVTLTVKEE